MNAVILAVLTQHKQSQLCENIMSTTKPEVHNILQHHQRLTEPWPQATCAKNLVKFRRVVSEIFDF